MTVRALALSLSLSLASTGALAAQPPEMAIAPGQAATVVPGQPPRTVTPPQPGQPPRTSTPPGAPVVTPPPSTQVVPRREGQAVNVKVDVTITDMRGGTAASKKTVSVVTADGLVGFIRSQANYNNIGEVPLNVDVEPFLLTGPSDGKIRVRVNLQYELPAPPNATPDNVGPQAGTLRKTAIHENLALILESGKPIVAAQSADPVGDRQVTIEIKATVLK